MRGRARPCPQSSTEHWLECSETVVAGTGELVAELNSTAIALAWAVMVVLALSLRVLDPGTHY